MYNGSEILVLKADYGYCCFLTIIFRILKVQYLKKEVQESHDLHVFALRGTHSW